MSNSIIPRGENLVLCLDGNSDMRGYILNWLTIQLPVEACLCLAAFRCSILVLLVSHTRPGVSGAPLPVENERSLLLTSYSPEPANTNEVTY